MACRNIRFALGLADLSQIERHLIEHFLIADRGTKKGFRQRHSELTNSEIDAMLASTIEKLRVTLSAFKITTVRDVLL
jgi:hypothetical protein